MRPHKLFNKKIKLPTTLAQFDALVDRVVKKYNLEDAHHAAAIISVAIRHLPNDQAYTTLSYLGQSVIKNISNHVANHKSQSLQHSAQIAHLVNMLETDPGNIQAIDELQKAANDGSAEAKLALDNFESHKNPFEDLN